MTASTSQAALAVNIPGGQVRQRGVLQVGVDLLDDRVPAVGLVRGDGVERSAGSAVVKNAWNRHTSNRVSCPAALFVSALKSGIRRTTSRPGTWSAFFLRGERGEGDLGDLGPGDPPAGGLVEDGVGVLDRGPRVLADRGDRGLDRAGPSGP